MNIFSTDVVQYNENSPIFRDSRTIGYCFTNQGNSILWINNFKLLPGATLKTFEPLMIDMTLYRVVFDQVALLSDNLLAVIIYNKQ
jgi:hypothetical protein